MKTKREPALTWWRTKSNCEKYVLVQKYRQQIPFTHKRGIDTLTGREVQIIYELELEKAYFPEGIE